MTEEKQCGNKWLPRRETVTGALLGIGGIIVVVLIVGWGFYRANNLVYHDASVRGVVADVGVRTEGRVSAILVQPNQKVIKGQVVARMENSHLQALHQEALSMLARDRQRLGAEELALAHEQERLANELERRQSQVQAAEAELQAARSRLARWSKEVERQSQLVQENIGSMRESDLFEAEQDVARALFDAARARLEEARLGLESARIDLKGLEVLKARKDALHSDVEVALARTTATEAELEAAMVRASADGWIVQRLVEPGSSVRVGDSIMRIWTPQEIWVEAWVREKDLGKVAMGSSASVTLPSIPGVHMRGKVDSIGVMTTSELGLEPHGNSRFMNFGRVAKVPVRIRLDTREQIGERLLLPGLSAVVGISKQKASSKAEVAVYRERLGGLSSADLN
jgi:membrane fusion protein, multidrug efflux system